jgi:hypothetical protein
MAGMSINLPRGRRGVLRPINTTVGEAHKWWVFDDLGPFDGPHETADAAWDRIVEIDAAARPMS